MQREPLPQPSYDERRVQRIFHGPTLGVAELNSTGEVGRINSRFEKLLERSAADLLGRDFADLVTPGPRWRFLRAFAAVARGEVEERAVEVPLVTRRGDLRRMELTLILQPTSVVGSPRVLVVAHDLTAVRERELELEAERDRAARRAERRACELEALVGELVGAEQRARERLAENLHGDLQQVLLGARMQLAGAGRDDLDHVEAIVDEAIALSRSLASDLRPPVLFQEGLVAALRWLAENSRARHGLSLRLDASDAAEPESDAARFVLFEVVRELLLNVVKHAGVNEATLEARLDGDEQVQLVVRDEGSGFDPRAIPEATPGAGRRGFGLRDMHRRVAALGGDIRFDSRVGKGTAVTIVVPRRTRSRFADTAPAESSLSPKADGSHSASADASRHEST